jgi:S-formylglutathione hydrolase
MDLIKRWKTCGGELRRYTHASSSTGTQMTFAVFLPPTPSPGSSGAAGRAPVLYWLSGLTCTDENFSQKAGAAFPAAAGCGLAIVLPDTSPRGADVGKIEGAAASWDFGVGAGFYVDATQAPWSANWRMQTYVTKELPALLRAHLGGELDVDRCSLSGHSMGGFGALQLALRHPGAYRSVSAFAPIAHPSACPWGKKAFTNYLGADEAAWAAYDPTELVKGYTGPPLHIKIIQGDADEFFTAGQLRPDEFCAAAKAAGVPVDYTLAEGYDHSYFLCVAKKNGKALCLLCTCTHTKGWAGGSLSPRARARMRYKYCPLLTKVPLPHTPHDLRSIKKQQH